MVLCLPTILRSQEVHGFRLVWVLFFGCVLRMSPEGLCAKNFISSEEKLGDRGNVKRLGQIGGYLIHCKD